MTMISSLGLGCAIALGVTITVNLTQVAALLLQFPTFFMAAAALAFVLTKFLNSSDYSSFDFAFYIVSFLIAEALLLRTASC